MATYLPLEILDLIAAHLQETSASLALYATVCRQWQAAFERIIYASLNVYSSNSNDQETFNRGLSLNHFQKLTSDSKRGLVRRGLIRHLRYHLVTPIDLPDWEARKKKGYKLDNETRKDNDAAFQSGIIDLFEILEPWCQSSRISVELILLGRKVGKEPYSDHFDIAGEYRFDFTDGQTKAVPVYRASFIGDDASLLPNVACIKCLSFPKEPYHRIWAGSAMQIAQHCSTITELRLDLDEYIRPDHLEYIQARREGKTQIITLRHGVAPSELPKNLKETFC